MWFSQDDVECQNESHQFAFKDRVVSVASQVDLAGSRASISSSGLCCCADVSLEARAVSENAEIVLVLIDLLFCFLLQFSNSGHEHWPTVRRWRRDINHFHVA